MRIRCRIDGAFGQIYARVFVVDVVIPAVSVREPRRKIVLVQSLAPVKRFQNVGLRYGLTISQVMQSAHGVHLFALVSDGFLGGKVVPIITELVRDRIRFVAVLTRSNVNRRSVFVINIFSLLIGDVLFPVNTD